jgi:ABC-type Fe3+ transport system substrate-binding protein
MAEVFKTDQAGETVQLFIQFVMMQHQQALFAMGKHPSAPPNAPPPNPKLASLFIDQLSMIRSKTAGNLSPDEERVIDSALAELREKFNEATTAPK